MDIKCNRISLQELGTILMISQISQFGRKEKESQVLVQKLIMWVLLINFLGKKQEEKQGPKSPNFKDFSRPLKWLWFPIA